MDNIRKYLNPILTLLMWVVVALTIGTTFSFLFRDSKHFCTITIGSVIIMVFTNIIWSSTGTEKAEKTAKVHNNTIIFNNRANYIVNNQMFAQTREFCKWRNSEYKKELITHKLAKRLLEYDSLIEYGELKRLSMQHEERLKDFQEFTNQFTKKQLKLLDKLFEHEVKFKELESDHLTKGHKTNGRLAPANREYIYKIFTILGKVVWGLCTGAFMSYILIQGKSKVGIYELYQLLVYTVTIIANVFTSIRGSFKAVYVYRNNYLVDKNDRCAEFFKYIGVQVKDVDQQVEGLLKKE